MISNRVDETNRLDFPEGSYKTVSFIIPTVGRDSIIKTLESIETYPGDEVLVVQFPPPPLGWGGRERTAGIAASTGDYLAFIDDDDCYVPGVRSIMHQAALENPRELPIIFRMQYPSGRYIWTYPALHCGNVGTPMIFVPNKKEMFPVWGDQRFADFNWLNSLGWEARRFIWREEVVAVLGHEDERWLRYHPNADQSMHTSP